MQWFDDTMFHVQKATYCRISFHAYMLVYGDLVYGDLYDTRAVEPVENIIHSQACYDLVVCRVFSIFSCKGPSC